MSDLGPPIAERGDITVVAATRMGVDALIPKAEKGT